MPRDEEIDEDDDDEIHIQWYHHAIAAISLALVIIGGLIGGAIGGASYALSMGIFKKVRNFSAAVASSLGISGAAFLLWFVGGQFILGLFGLGGGGLSKGPLDDDDYLILATSPQMREELGIDIARSAALIDIRVEIAEKLPASDEDGAQAYANEKGIIVKNMLNEDEQQQLETIYRKHRLLSVQTKATQGEIMLAFPNYGDSSQGNRPGIYIDGNFHEAISSRVGDEAAKEYKKQNHEYDPRTHVFYDDHVERSSVNHLIKSEREALTLIQSDQKKIRDFGLKWLPLHPAKSHNQTLEISQQLHDMLDSHTSTELMGERQRVFDALRYWAHPSHASRLEAIIRTQKNNKPAWLALINCHPEWAALLASTDPEASKYLRELCEVISHAKPESTSRFYKDLLPAWKDSYGFWRIFLSQKRTRLPFTPTKPNKPTPKTISSSALPDDLQPPNFSVITAEQKSQYINNLLKRAGSNNQVYALYAAKLMADPEKTPADCTIDPSPLTAWLDSPDTGYKALLLQAFTRWATPQHTDQLTDLVNGKRALGWNPAMTALFRINPEKAAKLYISRRDTPGFRMRVIGQASQASLGNESAWIKALETTNAGLFWDACYILSHSASEAGMQELKARLASDNTPLSIAHVTSLKLLTNKTPKSNTINRKSAPKETPSVSLHYKNLSDKKLPNEQRIQALGELVQNKSDLTGDIPLAPIAEVFNLIPDAKDSEFRLKVLRLFEELEIKPDDVPVILSLYGPLLGKNEIYRIHGLIKKHHKKLSIERLVQLAIDHPEYFQFVERSLNSSDIDDPLLARLLSIRDEEQLRRALHKISRGTPSTACHNEVIKILKDPKEYYGKTLNRNLINGLIALYLHSKRNTLTAEEKKSKIGGLYSNNLFPPSYDIPREDSRIKPTSPDRTVSPLPHFVQITDDIMLNPALDVVSLGRGPSYLTAFAILAEPKHLERFKSILKLKNASTRIKAECICAIMRLEPTSVSKEISAIPQDDRRSIYSSIYDILNRYPSKFKASSVARLAPPADPIQLTTVIRMLSSMGTEEAITALKQVYKIKSQKLDKNQQNNLQIQIKSAIRQCEHKMKQKNK